MVTAHRNRDSLLKMPSLQGEHFCFYRWGKYLPRDCAHPTTRNPCTGATLAVVWILAQNVIAQLTGCDTQP